MAKDFLGREIEVGMRVVRTMSRRTSGGSSMNGDLELLEVARVEGDKVWLGKSDTPMYNPQRLVVIPK